MFGFTFVWARFFMFEEASQTMSFSFALFVSLRLDWATTTGRLLGPATCLSHKDEGIPFSVFLRGHDKQACRLVLHTISYVLSAKQEGCKYHFLKSFSISRLGKLIPGLPTAKRTPYNYVISAVADVVTIYH